MCNCENIAMGSYDNQVLLPRPWHMYPTSRGDWIGIDRCLQEEILNLWRNGIWTLNCCCGHNSAAGYIMVDEMSIQRMKVLGYKPAGRGDLFYPKEICNHDSKE